MDESLNKQAQEFFRKSIDSYEAAMKQSSTPVSPCDTMTMLRQLAGCYLKLEEGDRATNLTTGIRYCIEALSIAQALKDEFMKADLNGKLGSLTFELGFETDSVNLVQEAISYHLEAASVYAGHATYWQQESMHYGYAANCFEVLPDSDSIPNVKRRIDLYGRMLGCLPSDVPQSYVEDINELLSDARKILNEG